LKNANQVIAVNELLAKTITEKTGVKGVVINNLVDETLFKPGKKRNGEIPKALFIGRLEKQKGVEYLIDALSQIQSAIELTIVGEGELEHIIREKIKVVGLENISIVGWKTQEELVSYYQSHDFFILPSLHENNPLVLIEAMACGLPIVATKCNGSEEIVLEEIGVLAEIKNADDLAQKIDWMVNNLGSFDHNKIREEFLGKYSSKVLTQKLISVYQSVINV